MPVKQPFQFDQFSSGRWDRNWQVEKVFLNANQISPTRTVFYVEKGRGVQIYGVRLPWRLDFRPLTPNACGSSVLNMLHITLLAPVMLMWLLEFWKMCALLQKGILFKSLQQWWEGYYLWDEVVRYRASSSIKKIAESFRKVPCSMTYSDRLVVWFEAESDSVIGVLRVTVGLIIC